MCLSERREEKKNETLNHKSSKRTIFTPSDRMNENSSTHKIFSNIQILQGRGEQDLGAVTLGMMNGLEWIRD